MPRRPSPRSTGWRDRATDGVPILAWAPGYRRSALRGDLTAGLTVAVFLVPQSMAYAGLAGLPAVHGLYAAVVSLVVYAVLGTSRHISVAPAAIDALLAGAVVGPLVLSGSARDPASAAALLAVLVGAVQVALGALRLGRIADFLSGPVITGFTAAAAVTIALTQLDDLLGLTLPPGSSSSALATLRALLPRLPGTDPATVALGGAAVVALVAVRRLAPRLPGPLLVVAGATVAVTALGLDREGVAVLGVVPGGLPTPALPTGDLDLVVALLPGALTLALVSYVESLSSGKAFAATTRSRVRPNSELLALGAANAAAGLVRGLPVAGGLARGALNVRAGAQTQLAGLVAAAGVAVTVLALTPLLRAVPYAALAAVIVVAVGGLVDVGAARRAFRIRRADGVSLLVTVVVTLIGGVAPGLVAGLVSGVAAFLYRTTHPDIVEVGRVTGSALYRNRRRYPTVSDPAVALLRLDAPLYFANASAFEDRALDLVASRPELRFLVLDCGAVSDVDATGAEILLDLDRELRGGGVELHLATVRGPVRDVLRRAGLWSGLVEAGRVHPIVRAAVAALPLDPSSPLRPDPAELAAESRRRGRPTVY